MPPGWTCSFSARWRIGISSTREHQCQGVRRPPDTSTSPPERSDSSGLVGQQLDLFKRIQATSRRPTSAIRRSARAPRLRMRRGARRRRRHLELARFIVAASWIGATSGRRFKYFGDAVQPSASPRRPGDRRRAMLEEGGKRTPHQKSALNVLGRRTVARTDASIILGPNWAFHPAPRTGARLLMPSNDVLRSGLWKPPQLRRATATLNRLPRRH